MTEKTSITGRRPLASGDLVLCAGTVLFASLPDRLRAARAAGFAGVSLWAEDYEQALAGGTTAADLRAMLDDHGLAVGEVDAVSRWLPVADGEEAPFGRSIDEILPIAVAVGARSINVVELFGGALDVAVAAEAFAKVCDRAVDHGLLVHLELLPWSRIPDVTVAWEIVRLAGRDNGGLMLDTWHHIRSNKGNAALQAIPAERIFALQLSDAPAEADGDAMDETLRRRRLPGAGDGNLAGLIRLLESRGLRAPVGVEVFSEDLQVLATDEVARRAWSATSGVLAQARGARGAVVGRGADLRTP